MINVAEPDFEADSTDGVSERQDGFRYQAAAIIFVQLVVGLASRVLSFGSAGPFCAGRPIVRDVRFAGGANRLASNHNRLMSVARRVMA